MTTAADANPFPSGALSLGVGSSRVSYELPDQRSRLVAAVNTRFMDMTHNSGGPLDEQLHPRDRGGRFRSKDVHEADGGLAVLGSAATNPPVPRRHVEDEQIHALLDPQTTPERIAGLQEADQPLELRLTVATTTHPGVAARAARDHDPVVRAAATAGWDLPRAVKHRLCAQADVAAVLQEIGAA